MEALSVIWNDILVDRVLAKKEVVDGLTAMLNVDENDIGVVEDIAQIDSPQSPSVVCVVSDLIGDFSLLISIYIRGYLQLPSLVEAVKNFCKTLECTCLVSDDSADPYTMLCIDKRGRVRAVNLDVDLLDETGQYKIASFKGEE
jgi:hypothetical protein